MKLNVIDSKTDNIVYECEATSENYKIKSWTESGSNPGVVISATDKYIKSQEKWEIEFIRRMVNNDELDERISYILGGIDLLNSEAGYEKYKYRITGVNPSPEKEKPPRKHSARFFYVDPVDYDLQ